MQGSLLDDLVGTEQRRFRDGDAERLDGLHVEHQPEFGRAAQAWAPLLCLGSNKQLAFFVATTFGAKIAAIRDAGSLGPRLNLGAIHLGDWLAWKRDEFHARR
jgi:hypothetical protein